MHFKVGLLASPAVCAPLTYSQCLDSTILRSSSVYSVFPVDFIYTIISVASHLPLNTKNCQHGIGASLC